MAEQHEWLSKALQCLRGAESEFANRRYDNAVNRAYYGCFQAAVAALMDAGKQPITEKGTRSHAVVQSVFAHDLIRRRKIYPAELASVLPEVLLARQQADYTTTLTSEIRAKRMLEKARSFIATVRRNVGDN
ncbi:MAG: HEPN domain-containing protein [Chloroflexi bacterium]|nr:HEPN domain-containing protein [Chloroflexota bacterium]